MTKEILKSTGMTNHDIDKYIENVSIYRLDEYLEDFAHELKERFNAEVPSSYPSTKPFFTLERARELVNIVLAEMENEE